MENNNKKMSPPEDDSRAKKLDNFLQLNATSLIASPLEFPDDHAKNSSLKRSIEPYCTVRKPRKRISFSPNAEQTSTDMGNNHGQPVASTDDDDDDEVSEFENSQDSTNLSLLKDFSDNDSCLDGIILSKDDPSTLSGPDYENLATPMNEADDLKFEDNFVPSLTNYCTVRQKPKIANPHDKIIAAYGTIKRKLKNRRQLTENEEELFKRLSAVTTFDCDAQVNDYLRELDAYLDEMDYTSSTATTTSSSVDDLQTAIAISSYATNSLKSENDGPFAAEDNESRNNETQQRVESDAMGSNCSFNGETTRNNTNLQAMANMNNNGGEQLKKYGNNPFCTLPKRQKKVSDAQDAASCTGKSEDELNANLKDEDECGVFRKGYSMRLPARPKLSWNGPNYERNEAAVQPNQRPQRNLSWLRKSMRKTSPIYIPDQENAPSHETFDYPLGVPNQSASLTAVENEQPAAEETASTSALTSENLLQRDAERESSLDDEFHSFNTTVYYDANSCHNSIPSQTAHITSTTSLGTQVPAPIHPELRQDDILSVLSCSDPDSPSRPRQLGRRSDPIMPRIASINVATSENASRNANERHVSIQNRPQLAIPATNSHSVPSSLGTSRNASPISLVSSTASSSITLATVDSHNHRSRTRRPELSRNPQNTRPIPTISAATGASSLDHDDSDDPETCNSTNSTKHKWPYGICRTLATSCCTIGLFNISRFSIFSIHFGANFIVQFLILSFLIGVPMLWLQMCLGAKIGGSPIGMWHISPICKGIGIALLIAHGITTLYSAISLGWVLMYLRDTFISRGDQYEWQKYFELYRGPSNSNNSVKLAETVADYFNGVILQRLHLGQGRGGGIGMGNVRFHLAFNLAIIWLLIFFILCRGIKSYGRFIIILSIVPIIGLIAVSSGVLSVVNFDSIQNIFPATDWQDFFINSRSWVSAAQETFLTWGLLGVSVYSIYCNPTNARNTRNELRRDAFIVVLMTIFVLILSAMFSSACVQMLHSSGYYYFPGSFENMGSYVFLMPTDRPLPSPLTSFPSKWLTRYSTVLGESFRKFGHSYPKESGYQVLRLVTELLPSTLAASKDSIPPVVSMLAYLTLLLFGLAQLATMWKPIATLLGDSPSGILLSCVTALFLGIPLATESGISILHFLDTVIGGAWWLLLLWFAHIIGVFLVRGRPYTSDILVKELHLFDGFSAFIAFSWNVLLPVGLMMLCIIEYRLSNVYDFFHWRGNSYWPLWSRQIAGIIQTLFLLIVPVTCIVQIYRYLSKGPPDILERIESLYRPVLRGERNLRLPIHRSRPPNMAQNPVNASEGHTTNQVLQVDEPPKYTPPPSYTTATGARIAKMLRQSIRRSMRRILGESSQNRRQLPPIEGPPPEYADSQNERNALSCIEIGPRPLYNSSTMERRRSLNNNVASTEQTPSVHPQDVALLLRPSRLLAFNRTMSLGDAVVDNVLRNSTRRHSRSVENLVLNAEQIGRSSLINIHLTDDSSITKEDHINESSVI
ncbi:sodium-dependent transporter bedraggled [Culicoides brevitarsis]|uniref:sodium-dependent transporter bedraggled n=1 Tax=Culicoides brevitarsis TaxID=469753 RepID=UPI00307BD678